ncbi:uncharacterized protein SCHCODRAFT_02690519 [Schizophyllum commune H4-8]|nr:uncharacterized protein SCHCODRAFT_02690519 [Schizophyllum commune H4-8]KAI5890580.1 hypothetical protein SCHCODRAFT_02690519 [Schizophyllum commune H4-8]
MSKVFITLSIFADIFHRMGYIGLAATFCHCGWHEPTPRDALSTVPGHVCQNKFRPELEHAPRPSPLLFIAGHTLLQVDKHRPSVNLSELRPWMSTTLPSAVNFATTSFRAGESSALPSGDKGPSVFLCKHVSCGKSFHTEEERRTHEKGHVVNEKGELRCPHRGCPYASASESKVLVHVNSFHRDLAGNRCQQPGCDYIAQNPRSLAAHVRSLHGVAASPRKTPTPSPFKKSPTKAKAKRIIQLRSIQPISWPLPGPASPRTPLPKVPEDNPFVIAETSALNPSENGRVSKVSAGVVESDAFSYTPPAKSPTTPHSSRRHSFYLAPLGEEEEEEE